ncbi:unnamed protein product [Vitrella brassicaformis CCMP3155]|uniref:Uncharacterized protein n=2 Tax=Vitrella brassicaformis TaxID=1169539 RepID=A0A0G4EJR1_VITBC|nr:unnamed protein product [Vitrella brassicaformis CCMP3155]|eukprot:CEL96749.1 unnamed protein product [Vitrella brassicaformis CCMP3155]
MNGASKRRSHRLLQPVFELYQAFPKPEHWQGKTITARIQRSEGDPSDEHPCMKTLKNYLYCIRGHRTAGHGKRMLQCRVEASLHKQCLEQNREWRPKDQIEYLPMLEHFRIFNETHCFKYPRTNLPDLGVGRSMSLGSGPPQAAERKAGRDRRERTRKK